MRSKDLKAAGTARLLVIGEDSNLQWSDTATEYAMFADYYFRRFPEDHGERSRNVEGLSAFSPIINRLTGRLSQVFAEIYTMPTIIRQK